MTTESKPTKSFLIIGIIALIWNLFGVMAFLMDVFITPEALAAMPENQRELYESNPGWMKIIYGIATFGGTFGCLLLLMKKASAKMLFIISLVAVLIQMIYSLVFTSAMEVYGPTGLVTPILVIAIAAFLVWYDNKKKANGWLK